MRIIKPGMPNLTLTAWTILSVGAATIANESDHDFFESKVRPVLIAHCIRCHGPEKQESGLRLDTRNNILTGGDSGPAVSLDRPQSSLFIQAIRHSNDLQMPPNGKLPPDQIDAITAWIGRDMPWPDSPTPTEVESVDWKSHWAFQPVRRSTAPSVDDQGWTATPIDRFVLAQLEANGLTSAPLASPISLIRRATFDLTGLPPTPAEVAEFEHRYRVDPTVAWEQLIDRLLNSPHYGERQARFWLDVARYADNKGYVFFEQKNYPWAWTYRDWVIDSFNQDLPYDQFVLLQLAADQVLPEQSESLAAMGFLTLGPRFMNNTHDVIDDRIDVVTRGLLGLTVTCARCHDHKFDPVPQEDYYSLYGIFRSSVEPTLRPLIRPAPESTEYQEFDKGLRERINKLSAFIDMQRDAMIQGSRARAAEYLLAAHEKRNHPTTENFMLLTDKGAINPAMLHRWEVHLKQTKRTNDPVWIPWHRFAEIPDELFAQCAPAVLKETSATDTPVNSVVRTAFTEERPQSIKDVARIYGDLFAKIDSDWQALVQQAGESVTRFDDDDLEAIRQVLYGANSPPMVPRDLGWGFLDLLPDRPTQNEYKKLLGEVEKFSTSGSTAPPRAMVLVDAETIYQPVVFQRGNPNREGATVPRRFLQALSDEERKTFGSGSGRIELARAIIDPDNPLTARVFVNRIWQQHFGTGFVETASDFGLRSSTPSHPELLDFLTAQFVDGGWSTKKLHRMIMRSATYRQTSSTGSGDWRRASKIDPANRLLWKFPRRRLDFESMRDAHLAVSGSIQPKLGGPPAQLLNGYNGRRTIYGFVNRMDLPGLMRTFDFPEPAATSPGRDVTTIPQQALFFLNHNFVSETAKRILDRPDVKAMDTQDGKLDQIHRILFHRQPTAEERRLARAFLNRDAGSARQNRFRYGYGSVDDAAGQVSKFTELTYWTGSRWQAGPKLPDPMLGWIFHDRTGGHPAAADDRCFILRWTAPTSGKFEISGKLAHRPEPGNGVRARVIASGSGIQGEWKVDQSEVETVVEKTVIAVGQTIDFVVDFQGHIAHDEFEWPVVIREIESGTTWNSQAKYHGPASDPWTNYVHALLMTNEFVFVE